jgi:hypothetical protein
MEPNFVIIKTPDPLALLVDAFPELRSLMEDADYGTYYVYERFSEHLSSHPDDEQLWERAYRFFETLATGNQSLQDLLVVGVFETLRADSALTQRLQKSVGPSALKLLRKMGEC